MSLDRRDIAPLLQPLFPSMGPEASSDDWHGFLNAMTGLDVPLNEENPTAFDKWRQTLSAMGYPVWDTTPAQATSIVQRGEALKAAEMARVAALKA